MSLALQGWVLRSIKLLAASPKLLGYLLTTFLSSSCLRDRNFSAPLITHQELCFWFTIIIFFLSHLHYQFGIQSSAFFRAVLLARPPKWVYCKSCPSLSMFDALRDYIFTASKAAPSSR
jgi:hypothetical protein